jgi:hypothetical protein
VSRIRIPDLFAGSEWEHALVLTYSLDLPFYERDLGRTLARVPNRIVLADARRLAEHFEDVAHSGEGLHGANIAYAVGGVTAIRAAHPKLVLLAAAASGLLAVGSGNLTLDGYASQGEQFCVYRYDGAQSDVPPFASARDLLDGLAARGWVDPVIRRHLESIWAGAPWLGVAIPGEAPRPVRHNLNSSLLSQFAETVIGHQVSELVVHAPFYDPGCEALRDLLHQITPTQVRVLVQEHETSVDPIALTRVLEQYPGQVAVQTVSAQEPGTYLHAKFILARTSEEDMLLSGSANISVSGLSNTADSGNVEVANVLSGPPSAFDYLLDDLIVGRRVVNPAALSLALRKDSRVQADQVLLRSAIWQGGLLTVTADRALPDTERVGLRIGDIDVGERAAEVDVATATFRLADVAAIQALERAIPIALLLFGDNGEQTVTAVTWPYHVDALRAHMDRSTDHSVLRSAGSLPADEEDLLDLLEELQRGLVIDFEMAWRLARREPVPVGGEEISGEQVGITDIDFEQLRRHPRVAQYMRTSSNQPQVEPTDLQVILTAINERFSGLHGPTMGTHHPSITSDTDEVDGGLSADDTDQDTEQERRRLSAQTRNRLAWQRFITRYLDGLSDPRFHELAGPVMLARNAAVFNHLLALLLQRGSIREAFGINGQLRLWHFFWGLDSGDLGLIGSLDDEALAAVIQVFTDAHTLGMILAALCQSQELAEDESLDDERWALRDFWRHLLTHPRVSLDDDVLLDAAGEIALDPADPLGALGDALLRLARTSSRDEVIETVAESFDSRPESCRIERARVIRSDPFADAPQRRAMNTYVLVIDDEGAEVDAERASTALITWMAVEQLEYYRLNLRRQRVTAVADRELDVYWLAVGGNVERLQCEASRGPAWLIAAENMYRRLTGASATHVA